MAYAAHGGEQSGDLPREWRPGTRPSAQPPRPIVRRLTERDRPALTALFDGEPGFSLFLAGNLAQFDLHSAFARYWGALRDSRLQAALMMVARRAALYAPPGVDVRPLAQVAAEHGVDFTMGRTDLVDALLAHYPPVGVEQREEHYLAGLPPTPPRAPAVSAPLGAVIRRATDADLDALTALYDGSAGFETLRTDQVRRTMAGRLRAMRTYVAQVRGQLAAAASTSAETPHAAMIGGVWTAPLDRNRGYSTAVVAALCRELLEEGRTPYLFYLLENATAAHVYAKIGFQVVGRWSVAYLRPT
jgi:hypothetical protein